MKNGTRMTRIDKMILRQALYGFFYSASLNKSVKIRLICVIRVLSKKDNNAPCTLVNSVNKINRLFLFYAGKRDQKTCSCSCCKSRA
jgi:hypothetical protein